jgi:addiction module RelE/StbE family toxin
MRKKFKIEYLPIAQSDLLDIFEYIFLDNPDAAEQFVNKIDKSIQKLESFPELGVVPKDDRLGLLGYRMLVIDNYFALYVIKDQIIEIRRIIHGKRKFSFLL